MVQNHHLQNIDRSIVRIFMTINVNFIFGVPSDWFDIAGLLCLWSLILSDAPEFVFTASSPILTARFHPDDPHLIVGGCYSGQVVLWDTRVSTHRPTMRSSITGKGHKHPVYSMCLVKSGGTSPILITISTDGTLCHWDLTNLNDPISSTTVLIPSTPPIAASSTTLHPSTNSVPSSYQIVNPSLSSRGKPLSASCMGIGPDEDNRKLIIGTEGGALCIFSLPFKTNSPFEHVCFSTLSFYISCRLVLTMEWLQQLPWIHRPSNLLEI